MTALLVKFMDIIAAVSLKGTWKRRNVVFDRPLIDGTRGSGIIFSRKAIDGSLQNRRATSIEESEWHRDFAL